MTHTVLLVEEDMELLRSLARMLASEPCCVYTVRSAAEAISLMKVRSIDAVVAGDGLNVTFRRGLVRLGRRRPSRFGVRASFRRREHGVGDPRRQRGRRFSSRRQAVRRGAVVRSRSQGAVHSDRLKAQLRLSATAAEMETDRRIFAEELELLRRQIGRDVERPLSAIAESCQTLLEKHPDQFDRKAKVLVEETCEAAADMQCLIEGLAERIRGRQAANLAASPSPQPIGQPDAFPSVWAEG